MRKIDPGLKTSIVAFEEYICFHKKLAACTVTAYLSRIHGFLRRLRGVAGEDIRSWQQIDRRLAQSYVEHLRSQDRSPATINLTTTSLRMFFDFLVARGEADVNHFTAPFDDIHHTRTPPYESHTLTDADIRVLVGAPSSRWQKDAGRTIPHFKIARDFSGYKARRDEAMIGLIFFAGLKTGEIASLPEDNFDRKNSMLLISSASKSRRVFLLPTVSCVFAESLDLKASLFPDSKHAFANKFGNKLSERSVHRLMVKYASDCDLAADMCPRDLRRAFERRLIMVETEEWLIRYLLGFEEYSLSEELVQAMQSALKKISERIGVPA